MTRPSPLIWLTLILLFLLPTAAGRFLIDLAGGLLLIFLALPILLAGAGWLGWRYLQSKMITCNSCGINFLNLSNQCPACGAIIKVQSEEESNSSIPASSATIDITAKGIDEIE